MQKIPLQPFGASSDDTITLLDGQVIPLIYVSFIPSTYKFMYTKGGSALDVTNLMTQAQKKLFPEFDVTENNYRIYNQKAFGINSPARLETSTAKMFVQNVADDLDKKTNLGVSSFASMAGLVAAGYIVFLIASNTNKKR